MTEVPWPLIAAILSVTATVAGGVIKLARRLDVIAERLHHVTKRLDQHSQDIDELKAATPLRFHMRQQT